MKIFKKILFILAVLLLFAGVDYCIYICGQI